MFKKESNNARYTAEDIERYHRGLLSGAERHALERAALEDPLLEEALEGYAGLPPGQAADDLSILRDRLAERVRRSRRLPVGVWWKAAAVLVLLAGAGSLVYERWESGRPSTFVARQVPVAPATAPADTPAAASAGGTADTAANAPATSPAAKDEAVLAPAPQTASTPQTATATSAVQMEEKRRGAATAPPVTQGAQGALADVTVAMEPKTATASASEDRVVLRGLSQPVDSAGFRLQTALKDTIAYPSASALFSKKMSAAYLQKGATNYFQNRVTDLRNQPISYASIQLLPSGHSLSTDQNGYFRLGTTDTGASLMVTAVGYTPKQYKAYELRRLSSLQLTEDSANLNKTVEIGPGDTKDWALRAKGPYRALMDTTSAQPLEGWSNYNDYISNNLQLPDEALLHHIHGVVDLTFQVDDTGKPVNISVAQSLCGSCDAEAIRLLLQGPEWKKGTEGKKAKGHLKVHF